ncbi:MAG: BPL-N domain-containing protein [Pseudomonadota bacterium]
MNSAPARLLYSAGGLWSLWTLMACRAAGWDIAPISAAQVAAGGLNGARALVAPGGWPALKAAALGPAGRQAVHEFVTAGGAYLGLCGGAGLALTGGDGLGLVDLGRTSGKKRLPSLSGPVLTRPGDDAARHPLWRDLAPPLPLHVWWPGQFAAPLPAGLRVVAAYAGPAPGLCTADLEVDQVAVDQWPALEKAYGLRLDPAGLAGLPAMVEAGLGRGRVLLSYLHLDTPGDASGRRALANLWQVWLGLEPMPAPPAEAAPGGWPAAPELASAADAVWQQGQDLGLWRPRHPAMPLWRRGARGLEFWSLRELCRALAAHPVHPGQDLASELAALLDAIRRDAPVVLAWQARALAGETAGPPPAASAWFPAPRRTGGDLARILERLELAIFTQEAARR